MGSFCGIESETLTPPLPHAFERFAQVRRTRSRAGEEDGCCACIGPPIEGACCATEGARARNFVVFMGENAGDFLWGGGCAGHVVRGRVGVGCDAGDFRGITTDNPPPWPIERRLRLPRR